MNYIQINNSTTYKYKYYTIILLIVVYYCHQGKKYKINDYRIFTPLRPVNGTLSPFSWTISSHIENANLSKLTLIFCCEKLPLVDNTKY